MSQRQWVKDQLEECRERCRARLEEASTAVSPVIQEHCTVLAQSTRTYMNDVIDSAYERYYLFEQRASDMCREEIPEWAAYEAYLLSDIARSIEFCEGLAEKFARLWEGLH